VTQNFLMSAAVMTYFTAGAGSLAIASEPGWVGETYDPGAGAGGFDAGGADNIGGGDGVGGYDGGGFGGFDGGGFGGFDGGGFGGFDGGGFGG
jgi:hypothetical protein